VLQEGSFIKVKDISDLQDLQEKFSSR